MRTVSPTLLAYLQARRGYSVRLLFWAEPRNRATGLPDPVGIWNGSETRDFVINGVTRTYVGIGGLVEVKPVISAIGTDIRMQSISVSSLSDDVVELIREHNARLAPAEIHRACFDTTSRELIEEPHRLFKGWIDKAPITRPPEGGQASCEITLASSARALTRTLTARKSDATQKLRSDDRFRRFGDIAGSVPVVWEWQQ